MRLRPRSRVALAACALLLAAAAPAPDPWRTLERLRVALAADGTLVAEFRQSFLPAGFTSGDVEAGELALAMPDCLRWDYRDPYHKTFLVCGDRAWSWVEGEPRGQRFTIAADREMGLDLLLLPAAELARRYRAVAVRTARGDLEITLEPLAAGAELVAATLLTDGNARRPLALDWRDREGSVTSFRFTGWRAGIDHEPFAPPLEVEWSEPAVEPGVR
jgi:hypothetical protein